MSDAQARARDAQDRPSVPRPAMGHALESGDLGGIAKQLACLADVRMGGRGVRAEFWLRNEPRFSANQLLDRLNKLQQEGRLAAA